MSTSPYVHEILIQKLKIKKQLEDSEFTNVIVSCDWDLHTWHQNHPDNRYGTSGTVDFALPSESFIPFDELDKDIVVSWVEENVPDLEEIKAQQEQIPALQYDDEEYEYLVSPFVNSNVLVEQTPEEEEEVPPVIEEDTTES